MENEDLKELIGLLKDTDITEIQLEKEGVKIKIPGRSFLTQDSLPYRFE